MIDKINSYKMFAEELAKEMHCEKDLETLFDELRREGDGGDFRCTEKDFRREMVCARTAVVCYYWEMACAEHRIEEEPILKAYLRAAMAPFSTPEDKDRAVIFSDYLHAPGTEDGSLAAIAITRRFFQRLNFREDIYEPAKTSKIEPVFAKVVYFFEGAKSEVMSRFQEAGGKNGLAAAPG